MRKAMKDTLAAGDVHDEETTGIGGQYASVVAPNPKCMGCAHYDTNRTYCNLALAPATCGEGSEPETGYAPVAPTDAAAADWKAKQGATFQSPVAQADSGHREESPDFVVEVLGDEGFQPLELSMKGDECKKCGYLMKGPTCSRCKYKSLKTPLAFDATNKVGGPVLKATLGTKRVHETKHSAYFAHYSGNRGHHELKHLDRATMRFTDLGSFHNSKASMAAAKKHAASYKPVSKSAPWAIATAAWQKVSAAKRGKYIKQAAARGKDASEYANKPPQEFVNRIARKGGASLVEEFGHHLSGVLLKARFELRKSALAAIPKLKKPVTGEHGYKPEDAPETTGAKTTAAAPRSDVRQGQQAKNEWKPGEQMTGVKLDPSKSPILHAVRRKQMENPSPLSQAKARQAGGGKVFSHASLAQHAGVKPEVIADLAHASSHAHDFHNAVRSSFGDKVKHLTSGQIRSAYHSTGLMHSMPLENDMEKAGGKMGHGSFGAWKQRRAQAKAKAKYLSCSKCKGTSFQGVVHSDAHVRRTGVSHSVKCMKCGHTQPYATKHGVSSQKVDTAAFKPQKTKKSLDTALLAGDLDLIKAHRAGKRHVIGHTSTGKPVHSDAHGAEGLNHEEHREAGGMHDDLASRLSDAAYGFSGMGGSSRGKLPPASFKYLQNLSEHHRHIANRHHKTANLAESSGPSAPMPAEPFGKSKPLTDNDVAKAIASGSLAHGAMVSAPMHLAVREPVRYFPKQAEAAPVVKSVPIEEPKRPAATVGGVLSAAWDLGNYRG